MIFLCAFSVPSSSNFCNWTDFLLWATKPSSLWLISSFSLNNSVLTLESRSSILSRLLLLWMRPLIRLKEGLPWLPEEAPALEVSELGVTLRDKTKAWNQLYCKELTPWKHATGMTENMKNIQRPSFKKGNIPCWMEWHSCIIGFNVTSMPRVRLGKEHAFLTAAPIILSKFLFKAHHIKFQHKIIKQLH